MSLGLIYITNNPAIAVIAEKNDVESVMIDLEIMGKEERQKNMNTVKSYHKIADVRAVSEVLTKSETLVRINPWNESSRAEIDEVISSGADRIMLPMWKNVEDVKSFLDYVGGRVRTTLLLETREAVDVIDDVLKLKNIDTIHIGLNDLHLSYRLTFMFELLANGVVECLCNKFKERGIEFGFGGIARIGEGTLPAEAIVAEHYRLGSSKVILSRGFCNSAELDINSVDSIFNDGIKKLRAYENSLKNKSDDFYMKNTEYVKECVDNIVCGIKGEIK